MSCDNRQVIESPVEWDNYPHHGLAEAPSGQRTGDVIHSIMCEQLARMQAENRSGQLSYADRRANVELMLAIKQSYYDSSLRQVYLDRAFEGVLSV